MLIELFLDCNRAHKVSAIPKHAFQVLIPFVSESLSKKNKRYKIHGCVPFMLLYDYLFIITLLNPLSTSHVCSLLQDLNTLHSLKQQSLEV